jgi:hypothetical protein
MPGIRPRSQLHSIIGDFKGGRLLRSKPVRTRRLLPGKMPMTTWVTGSSRVMTISGRRFAVGEGMRGGRVDAYKIAIFLLYCPSSSRFSQGSEPGLTQRD